MEYKIISKHFYTVDEKGKHITLIEKVGYGNKPSIYKIRENKKTRKVTSEYYHNEIAKTIREPPSIIKKIEKVKEQDKYDEYEYMVGFDYITPTITSGGKTLTKGSHGKHDFKTEYRITSPVPLNSNDIQKLIQSKFSDYFNVLKNDESYEIKEETHNKVNERPDIEVKQTEKIKR